MVPPPSAAPLEIGDLLAGDIATELWNSTDRSRGMHSSPRAEDAPASTPPGSPVSPVPCPVSPFPCGSSDGCSPEPCPVSPVPCPISPFPCGSTDGC